MSSYIQTLREASFSKQYSLLQGIKKSKELITFG